MICTKISWQSLNNYITKSDETAGQIRNCLNIHDFLNCEFFKNSFAVFSILVSCALFIILINITKKVLEKQSLFGSIF